MISPIRWENPATARYYEALLQQNLFGDWEVLRLWGGIGSRQGGHQCDPVPDLVCGMQALDILAKHRMQRGYWVYSADSGRDCPAAFND